MYLMYFDIPLFTMKLYHFPIVPLESPSEANRVVEGDALMNGQTPSIPNLLLRRRAPGGLKSSIQKAPNETSQEKHEKNF